MENNSTFLPTTYDLGDVQLRVPADAVFTRSEGGLPIRRIEVSCQCTSYQVTDTQIRVTLSVLELPEGVVESGETSFTTLKTIQVIYSDDTFQTLFIAARVSQ